MYVAGIDAGSVGTKVIILNADNDEVVSYVLAESEPDVESLAWKVLNQALNEAKIEKENLEFIVGTGYGRNIIPFANDNRTEIACHVLGVNHIFPSVRTIIDVGGQDSKAMRITPEGQVVKFVMNDRCAAGTGRFSDVMSNALDVPFERWGDMVRQAKKRARISSYCTVFAESEAISLMAQKTPVDEILAGLCEATATRVLQLIRKLGRIEKDVCFTGGVALNSGIAYVLQEKLGVNLLIPKAPQSTGAVGAAIVAKRMMLANRC